MGRWPRLLLALSLPATGLACAFADAEGPASADPEKVEPEQDPPWPDPAWLPWDLDQPPALEPPIEEAWPPLGGEPLDGALEVTAVPWEYPQGRVEGARVVVQGRGFEAVGTTGADGRARFASPDLRGPVTITVVIDRRFPATFVDVEVAQVRVPLTSYVIGDWGFPSTLHGRIVGLESFGEGAVDLVVCLESPDDSPRGAFRRPWRGAGCVPNGGRFDWTYPPFPGQTLALLVGRVHSETGLFEVVHVQVVRDLPPYGDWFVGDVVLDGTTLPPPRSFEVAVAPGDSPLAIDESARARTALPLGDRAWIVLEDTVLQRGRATVTLPSASTNRGDKPEPLVYVSRVHLRPAAITDHPPPEAWRFQAGSLLVEAIGATPAWDIPWGPFGFAVLTAEVEGLRLTHRLLAQVDETHFLLDAPATVSGVATTAFAGFEELPERVGVVRPAEGPTPAPATLEWLPALEWGPIEPQHPPRLRWRDDAKTDLHVVSVWPPGWHFYVPGTRRELELPDLPPELHALVVAPFEELPVDERLWGSWRYQLAGFDWSSFDFRELEGDRVEAWALSTSGNP